MTIKELQKQLQQAVRDLDKLPPETIITDFNWLNPGSLRLLIAHDQDFENIPGERVWVYQEGLNFPWEASIQVESIECHNRYQHHPDTSTVICVGCQKEVEEWYEGIPNKHAPLGNYCKECWEVWCK